MSPRRKLPPLASEADRIEAARIAADQLAAELREGSLYRRAWSDGDRHGFDIAENWNHYIDSAGAVHSERT